MTSLPAPAPSATDAALTIKRTLIPDLEHGSQLNIHLMPLHDVIVSIKAS